MKQKFSLLVFAAVCVLRTNAQLILTQSFTNTSSVFTGTNSWIRTNNSQPQGVNSWLIGNPAIFNAYSGADSSYVEANFNATTGNSGIISDWLITPTLLLSNGGVIQFATRTAAPTTPTVYPDRLELYMNTSTVSSVGNTASSTGNFTNLLLSINPSLTPTGYPTSWTVYTATVSGLTNTVTGRFGFRYYVTAAGPNGTNSNYIGIDEVSYALPCPNPTISITQSTTDICSGDIVTLTGSGANTYTWSTGQTTPTVAVSPNASSIYTLMGSSTPNCNSTETVAITVTLTPNLAASDVTTCPGTAATLAVSGAASYSWETGATTPSIVVTPTTSTSYSVTGYNGGCQATKIISVTFGTFLSIDASAAQSTICGGSSTTLTANGASSYTWNHGSSLNSPINVITPSVTTKYIVKANDSSGTCLGMDSLIVSVIPSPTLSIVGSPTLSANTLTICSNTPITLTVSGASTYSWTGTFNTTPIRSATTPSTNGTYYYSVVGTGTNGCATVATATAVVSVCTGVETITFSTVPVSIFPNPFTGQLNISNVSGTVEIFNALGQLMLKQQVDGQASLQTDSFAKGIYILKAYDGGQKLVTNVKLIKN